MRPAATFRGMTVLDSIDSTLYPSRFDLAFRALWRYIPEPLLHYVRYLPLREYRRLRTFLDYSTRFSRNLVRQTVAKRDGKDMMSVLLRANASENPNSKLTDDEVIYQISCVFTLLEVILLPFFLTLPERSNLLLAGHDTTASTLTWFLWEVAKHPESQERIRSEIAAFREEKGEEHPTATDLDNMAYTQAALKVLPHRTMPNRRFLMIGPSCLGVDEAAPHRLDSSQSSGTRRCDPFGLPYHYEIGRANFIHPDQERHAYRHLH